MADAAVKWTDKLKGSFELIMLFGRGMKPFEADPSKAAALRSLWIPVVLFPISLACAYLWPPKDLVAQPMEKILTIITLNYVLGFFVGLGILYLAVIAFNRRDRFWLTFHAGNWVSIPLSLVSAPFLVAALMQWYPREQMDNVFMAITYYGVFVTGCIVYRGLKIGWEMAGFLACMGIFVNQQLWNGLFWVFDVPINWGL